MKNLRHILPLYIGQKVIDPRTGGTETITGINGRSVLLDSNRGASSMLIGNINATYMKLLLRPLSSMTEEEARELCQILEVDFFLLTNRDDNVTISFDGIPSGILTLQDDVKFRIDSMLCLPFEIAHWLCSKGFDLFNLIGQGIAKPIEQ